MIRRLRSLPLIAMITILIGSSAVAGVRLMVRVSDAQQLLEAESSEEHETPTAIISLLADPTLGAFRVERERDLLRAQSDHPGALALHRPGPFPFLGDLASVTNHIKIAQAAQVDGVVLIAHGRYASDALRDAAEAGLVTGRIGFTSEPEDADLVVGLEPHSIAQALAGAVASALPGSARIGYLCGTCRGTQPSVAVVTLQETLEEHGHELIAVQVVGMAEMGTTPSARVLLGHEIDVVYADTLEGSVALAQLLVDANRVGSPVIIATGKSDRLTSYIEDSVVHASLVPDYELASRALLQELEHGVRDRGEPVLLEPELEVIYAEGPHS
ncbi:MAG: hypothetical protein ACOC8L_01510 [Spirochaetota bacterium]